MSLSIDAHHALAAFPSAKTASADAADDQASANTQDAAPAASAAYTIDATASTPASTASAPLSGVKDDLDGDGARLVALQVRQALAGQSVSVANQSSQTILSLFRA